MKVKYISLLFAVLLMASCEKEIKFNSSETEALVALNGVFMADSAISIQLSKTRFFLENSGSFTDIENAEVTLTSGKNTEQLKYSGSGVYTGTYIPQTGEKVELKVVGTGLPTISASTEIPAQPQIGDPSVEKGVSEYPLQRWDNGVVREVGANIYTDVKIKISITDSREEQNYYRLVVRKVEHYPNHVSQSYLSGFSDPVFKTETPEVVMGMSEQSNRYNIFSDVRFNGTTYQLSFNDEVFRETNLLPQYEEYNSQTDAPIRVVYYIEVQQLSHDYFLYLRTRDAYLESDSDDIPFMEAIQIFSNIESGTGILGSAAVTKRTVEVNLAGTP